MSEVSEKLLVELLIKENLFSRERYNALMQKRPAHETSIRSYLVHNEFVTEKQILEVLSKEQGVPIADLISSQPDVTIRNEISYIHATSFQIFPLRKDENGVLVLGFVDILDANLVDDINFSLNKEYVQELISVDDYNSLLKKYYEDEGDTSTIEEGVVFSSSDADQDNDDIDPTVNDAPVVVLLNNILLQAINDHASDVHFEPYETEFRIRYRIDGTLYEMIPPPRNLALSVLSRIKVMAKMNIAEKRVPQDGRISLKVNGKPVDLRVSTIPTAYGESAVLRVLDRSNIQLDLDKLGLTKNMIDEIKKIIFKPNGIFITTGPTGAGKTTTLYSCLKELNTIDSKLITTEDPVEYDIEGITQVAINDNIGLTFAACLRSILRQDPDRIMVGEIRDLETMNMAIQASLTGHLVLSTLHTNDSCAAITRLNDMGVEPFLICSSLEAVVAQRLVRKVCPDCKISYTPNEAILKMVGIDSREIGGKQFFKGKGCDNCNGIGYKGRVGIYELLVITEDIRKLIMKQATATMIKELAIRNGMRTLLEDGLEKIESGLTTVEEVAMWATE